jgi:hypothetical protein
MGLAGPDSGRRVGPPTLGAEELLLLAKSLAEVGTCAPPPPAEEAWTGGQTQALDEARVPDRAQAPDRAQTPDQVRAVDQLRALEILKSAACAAQARLAVRLDESVRSDEARAGIPAKKRGLAVASQIALARRESPHRGRIQLGLAKMLVREMPCTLKALGDGALSGWRATVIVRETACLSLDDRMRIDEQLCGDPSLLEGKGDRQLAGEAKAAALALDSRAVVNRSRKAVSERTVTCRPAPDTMVYLSGLLPVAQGIATYKALSLEADRCRAAGDPRSRGQVMADTLVERVTGHAGAGAAKVELQVVVTDRVLFQGDAEPAYLNGYGIVPAQWVRDLARLAPAVPQASTGLPGPDSGIEPDPPPDASVEVWLRRLYTAPTSGQLVAMDSRARSLPENMRRFIVARDRTCRRPWCDAPIRHHDHVVPVAAGGETNVANAEGLCEACNYSKDAEGWSTHVTDGVRGTIVTTTPTGHSYTSTAAAPPGTPVPGDCSGELVVGAVNPRALLLRHLRRPGRKERHRSRADS